MEGVRERERERERETERDVSLSMIAISTVLGTFRASTLTHDSISAPCLQDELCHSNMQLDYVDLRLKRLSNVDTSPSNILETPNLTCFKL